MTLKRSASRPISSEPETSARASKSPSAICSAAAARARAGSVTAREANTAITETMTIITTDIAANIPRCAVVWSATSFSTAATSSRMPLNGTMNSNEVVSSSIGAKAQSESRSS